MKRIEITKDAPYVLIGVYGTLRKGEGNYKWILQDSDSEFIGDFKTDPMFTMYGKNSGFPIVSPKGNTSIKVEVFKVKNANTLEQLHRLEGCTGIPGDNKNWYDITAIKTPFGENAYIYVQDYQGSEEEIIKSGDWKNKKIA